MLTYLLKRLLATLPIALGVTVVCFLLVTLAPGDPLNAIAPADAPAEVISALKAAYGLDRPLPVRYGLWLARAAQGPIEIAILRNGLRAAADGGAMLIDALLARSGQGLPAISRSMARAFSSARPTP